MLLGLLHRLGRPRVPSHALVPGGYVTDGRRLFCVVSRLAAGDESVLVLEDCVTLEVHLFARTELDAMALRAVQPTDTVGAQTSDISKTHDTGDHALAGAQADRARGRGGWDASDTRACRRDVV